MFYLAKIAEPDYRDKIIESSIKEDSKIPISIDGVYSLQFTMFSPPSTCVDVIMDNLVRLKSLL